MTKSYDNDVYIESPKDYVIKVVSFMVYSWHYWYVTIIFFGGKINFNDAEIIEFLRNDSYAIGSNYEGKWWFRVWKTPYQSTFHEYLYRKYEKILIIHFTDYLVAVR